MQVSDDVFLGPAFSGGSPPQTGANLEPSPMELGIGPSGRIFSYDVQPLALGTANVAALQTTAGAANLVLTAATGVTRTTAADGTNIRYVFDVPRAVSLTSAGNISAVNFTITGFDAYGQAMTQTLAGPNANTVTTLKAFASVINIAVSAAVATNTSAGTSDRLGLPVAVLDAGYVVQIGYNGALAKDAGTFTAAVVTNPSTAALGDVRGTYTPSAATDGTKRLVFTVALSTANVGPKANRIGAFGVTQV